jgi:uncharacterized protein YjiS (DUF1127 family)
MNKIITAEAEAPSQGAPISTVLSQQIAAAWSRYLTWRSHRATRSLLLGLDDRSLQDIGLKRSEIDKVIREIMSTKPHWHP